MCVDECLHVQRVFVGVCGCVWMRERETVRGVWGCMSGSR